MPEPVSSTTPCECLKSYLYCGCACYRLHPHCTMTIIFWDRNMKRTVSIAFSFTIPCCRFIFPSFRSPQCFLRGVSCGSLGRVSAFDISGFTRVQTAFAVRTFSSKMPHTSAFITFHVIVTQISRWSLLVLALCATGSCMLSRASHGAAAARSS